MHTNKMIIKAANFNVIKKDIRGAVPFISFVVTSWHFDNLIAYLLLNNLRNGVVIVRPQGNIKNKTKYRLSEENFFGYEYLFDRIYFLHSSYIKLDIYALIRYSYAVFDNTLYLIVPGTRLSIRIISSVLYLQSVVKTIIIDEGLGCYLPYENFVSYGNTNPNRRKINNFIYLLLKDLIINRYSKKAYNFCLFHETYNGQLICNNPLSISLKSIYTDRFHKIDKQKNETIIIYKDFGVVDFAVDLDIYSRLLDFLQHEKYLIYIKKHPNDINPDFDIFLRKYQNVRLLDNKKSAEEIVPIYTPKILIGGYTTALFSSANIFQIKSISFMMMYISRKEVPAIIKTNISFFRTRFNSNNYLFFSLCFEELFEEMSNVLNINSSFT
jgi:hypothetical protein